MTNFPISLDDDGSLPRVDDNVVEIGGDAINAVRSATFSIEENIGIGAAGSLDSVAERLAISMNADGTIKPSSLLSIGLVALPINNTQISATAAISESKLSLTYSTSSLYSSYSILKASVDNLNAFLSTDGIRVAPHIAGSNYKHTPSHINTSSTILKKTNPILNATSIGTSVINRNNTNLETLLADINTDLVVHEKSDGSSSVNVSSGGTIPPLNYAHNALGIHINTANFSSIPQSNTDIQKVVDFIDSSNVTLIGGRTQNLFSNGVSRGSRSTTLVNDGYNQELISTTPITAYLLKVPQSSSTVPYDGIDYGDDIILFQPTTAQKAGFVFDSRFALVRSGDEITVNYGTGIDYKFIIEAVQIDTISRIFKVRINGKNPYGTIGTARINKPFFNRNKYNVLANARVPNNTIDYETLITASPRGALAIGLNFNPSQFNTTHYNLYLHLLQDGSTNSIISLPAVDVTGNKGTTPGKYTLKNIINATNAAFRFPGFNYRFIAFEYEGQFGIALADHYRNTSFSIIEGITDTSGDYILDITHPNNVVDGFLPAAPNSIITDPLGFGRSNAGLGSPSYLASCSNSAPATKNSILVFPPLKKNFYYVNGAEKDTLKSVPASISGNVDVYGDYYWPATITSVISGSGKVEVQYRVDLNISQSGLQPGKTIVVQPNFAINSPLFNITDYGRFTIKGVDYTNCSGLNPYVLITVYDGVHGAGISPAPTSTGIIVNIYFTDDSVCFNNQNATDLLPAGGFKRYFENYVDKNGHTFTHERARFIISGNIGNINLYNVSPKLRGYSNGAYKEIRLKISSYNGTTGIYSGYLAKWDGFTESNVGSTIFGKKGEFVRFYDETNIDFIDFIFDLDSTISTFTNETVVVQLFKSLALDQEIMFLSTCQMNDNTKKISYLNDKREFGNISEENLTKSAYDFITAVPRAINKNRILKGFEYSILDNELHLTGGSALIDGKIVLINNSITSIPILCENPSTLTINWIVCANKLGQIELIADTNDGRLFYVINPNQTSPIPYAIRSAPLFTVISDFIDVRPILTILTTVSSTIIGSTIVSNIPTTLGHEYGSIELIGDGETLEVESGGIFKLDSGSINTMVIDNASSSINISNGASLIVASSSASNINVGAGSFLTVNSGATSNINVGSVALTSASGGKITFATGSELKVNSGAQLNTDNITVSGITTVNNYPLFSTPKTKSIFFGLEGARKHTDLSNVWNIGREAVNPDATARMWIELATHNGATLDSVDVYYSITAAHTTLPTEKLNFYIARKHIVVGSLPSPSMIEEDMTSLGTTYHYVPGSSISTYESSGNFQVINIPTPLNNIIDTSSYIYEILCVGESGTGFIANSNVIYGFKVNFSNISSLQFP